MDYFCTRKLEEQKLNKILSEILEPRMPKDIIKNKTLITFNINGYSEPYDSTITFYYNNPLDLPNEINGTKIKQIFKLKCRDCMAMAYMACFCGKVPTDKYITPN